MLHRRLWMFVWLCLYITPCLKNVPPLAYYKFDTCEWILVFFGRNVTDKVGNQITIPSQITCASALPGKTGKQKLHYSLKCCINALPEFNQLLDSFNLFDSRLILTLLYNSLNRVINVFSSGLLGAWLKGDEVESAEEVGLCCTNNAPLSCLLGFLFRKVTQKH